MTEHSCKSTMCGDVLVLREKIDNMTMCVAELKDDVKSLTESVQLIVTSSLKKETELAEAKAVTLQQNATRWFWELSRTFMAIGVAFLAYIMNKTP